MPIIYDTSSTNEMFRRLLPGHIQKYVYGFMKFPKLSDSPHRAYKDGLYTDLRIICGRDEFMVHKIIVCSQSKVFHAMCSGSFRVHMILQKLYVREHKEADRPTGGLFKHN